MFLNTKGLKALENMLGDNFMESLKKSEIYKINTNTVLSPDEIKVSLQIVPRTILQWLFANLKNKDNGHSGKIPIPFEENAEIQFLKNGGDNYSGEIYKEHKKICEFKNRSLPGIGLLILTSFELYDEEMLKEIKQQMQRPDTPWVSEKINTLEHMIHQKLLLQQLVEEVVNKKLSERDAIDRLLREKLNDHISIMHSTAEPQTDISNKKNKLKEFIRSIKDKRQEEVKIEKSEISCPDCGTDLYKKENNKLKLCICYGQFHKHEIKIKKAQNGKLQLSFPKSFDAEDAEMLLEAIKNK